MTDRTNDRPQTVVPPGAPEMAPRDPRPRRADARRNIEALLAAAKIVFATSGVDAPGKQIVAAAGLGVGTLYRHFPTRADLVKAVLEREFNDAYDDEALTLLAANAPSVALEKWLCRFITFVFKHGLADALHSGDPAFAELPTYLMGRFRPGFESLFKAATDSGEIPTTADAQEILLAVTRLCRPSGESSLEQSRRMVKLVINGLRFEAASSPELAPAER